MASAAERRRNNLRTGIFVTVALALGMIIILSISDISRFLREPNRYLVYFTVETGVADLAPGSKVRIGGLPIGAVEEVHLTNSAAVQQGVGSDANGSRVRDMILVEFTVDPQVTLFDNPPPAIVVSGPIIGAESWLEIVRVGGPMDSGTLDQSRSPWPEDQPIRGEDAPGLLVSMFGADAAEVRQNIIEFTQFAGAFSELYRDDVQPVINTVADTTDNMRDFSAKLNDVDLEQWNQDISSLLAWIDTRQENVDRILEDVESVSSQSAEMLAENREPLNAAITNTEAMTSDGRAIVERFRHDTHDKIDALADSAVSSLDATERVLVQLQRDYPSWATNIEEMLANSRLASQQLKLAAMEIRRSPWKLTYQPSTRELEHEFLYEATRSFALAASDLRTASEAAERLVQTYPERFEQQPELLDRLRQTLVEPLDRYQWAQQQLFEAIKQQD